MDRALTSARLVGKSAREILDIIIDVVRPVDGTQDSDASRHALSDARADLLDTWPEIDLLTPTPEQAAFLVESYVANDICRRIELDIGRNVVAKASDPVTAVRRLEELKSYVTEKVRAAFRGRQVPVTLDRAAFQGLANAVIADTLDVFEGYLQ